MEENDVGIVDEEEILMVVDGGTHQPNQKCNTIQLIQRIVDLLIVMTTNIMNVTTGHDDDVKQVVAIVLLLFKFLQEQGGTLLVLEMSVLGKKNLQIEEEIIETVAKHGRLNMEQVEDNIHLKGIKTNDIMIAGMKRMITSKLSLHHILNHQALMDKSHVNHDTGILISIST